jgi:hypothetical protein
MLQNRWARRQFARVWGDIVPNTDPARILVSTQMLLNLVIIGAVVKLLATAARTGLERTRRDHPGRES